MKRLTQRNILHYLVDRGFLDTTPLMDGRFKMTMHQTRNCIFILELEGQDHLFVKQLVELDASNVYFMQKDATLHHLVHQQGYLDSLAPYVPRYFGYDPKTQVIVLEYYPNALNLMEYYHSQKGVIQPQMKTLAYVFSELHRDISADIDTTPSLQFYNRLIPWILRLNDRIKPSKSIVIRTLLQDQALMHEVETIKRLWRVETLVHSDVKLANILAVQTPNAATQLKVIDWEMAIIGDPLWDVAGLVQSFIAIHLAHIQEDTRTLNHDFYAYGYIQDCLQTFWLTYAQYQGWDTTTAHTQRLKMMRFAGARLLQTAIEMHGESAEELDFHVLQVIDEARNIIQSPEQAIERWM